MINKNKNLRVSRGRKMLNTEKGIEHQEFWRMNRFYTDTNEILCSES